MSVPMANTKNNIAIININGAKGVLTRRLRSLVFPIESQENSARKVALKIISTTNTSFVSMVRFKVGTSIGLR